MRSLNRKIKLSQEETAQIIGGTFAKSTSQDDNVNTTTGCICYFINTTHLTNDNQAIECVCMCDAPRACNASEKFVY
jgi:hypothetical protein